MTTSFRAHFDGEYFVPDEPVVGLAPGDEVEVLHVSEAHITSPNGKEWAETVRQLIELHPVVNHFVDDSRESIYSGRGE
jgi:hypothetical protein